MKTKVSEASGPVLDLMVAMALKMSWWTHRTAKWDNNEGYTDWILDDDGVLKKFWFDGSRSRSGHWGVQDSFTPSTDWAQGGPIIERELLDPDPLLDTNCALIKWRCRNWKGDGSDFYGPTPLVAAMRCFVASKLGDEVDVPEELL